MLGGVAAKLGITPTQLKTWRLELEAAGSATASPLVNLEKVNHLIVIFRT